MRILSSALLRSKNAIDGGNPWGFLAELTIAGAPAPLRYTSDVQVTTFHGLTFTPFPMDMDGIEESSQEVIQRLRITVPNVNQEIIALCEQYWATVAEPDWEVSLWQVDLTQPNETPLVMREVFTVEGITTDLVNASFDLAAAGKTLAQLLPGRRYNSASGFPLLPRI